MDISKWQWNQGGVIVVALVIRLSSFSAPIYLLIIFALILSMLLLSPVKWLKEKWNRFIFRQGNRRNLAVCIFLFSLYF